MICKLGVIRAIALHMLSAGLEDQRIDRCVVSALRIDIRCWKLYLNLEPSHLAYESPRLVD